MTNALIIYLGLAALAAVEASPLGYLIPGTLGVIAAGGLVQIGELNGPATLISVWVGVLGGDVVTYWLARRFGDVLRRWRSVASALGRAEVRIKSHPVAFIFFAHLSPFLKNAVSPAAGLAGISWSRFFIIELGASLLDATWFLSIGYIFSRSVGEVTEMPIAARVVSVLAISGLGIFLLGRGRSCAVPRSDSSNRVKTKRGCGFFLKVLFLIGPWELAGRLAKGIGAYDRPDYRSGVMRAIEVAHPGDVILVGREIAAPWGEWSHVGIIVDTPAGKAVLHAYEEDVRLTGAKAYPMSGKVAIARLNCTENQRQTMVAAAWGLLGEKFRLNCRKPGIAAPGALNCVGLVEWAAAQSGISLNEIPAGGVVTPDDVLSGGNAFIVFMWRDGDGLVAPPLPADCSAMVALSKSAAPTPQTPRIKVDANSFLGVES